jgi:acyl carrier protein
MDIERRIIEVLARVFGLPEDRVGRDFSVETVPQWDSMKHVTLVLELEKEFGVRFGEEEIVEMLSLEVIRSRVEGKVKLET